MGEPQEFTVQRILNINTACGLISENTALDAVVSFRMGRLGDYTDSIVRRLRNDQRKREVDMTAKLSKLTGEEKKKETDRYKKESDDLMNQIETMKAPKFKFSDFVASEDRTILDAERKAFVIKVGQPLVPVRFFALMGDLIEDDKGHMKGLLDGDPEVQKEAPVRKLKKA